MVVAELIVLSAMSRQESRGLHFTLDYPDMLDKAEITILVPDPKTSRKTSKVSLLTRKQ